MPGWDGESRTLSSKKCALKWHVGVRVSNATGGKLFKLDQTKGESILKQSVSEIEKGKYDRHIEKSEDMVKLSRKIFRATKKAMAAA
jgi:hypothetical protein